MRKLILNYTDLPKYYAQLETAVVRGLGWPACRQAGPHTHAAPKHSLLFQFSFSHQSHLMLTFIFFTEPVSLNLLACLLIVLGLGTGRPGNFTLNLRSVSEHDFLLFIYVLWIYKRSNDENSCLGMSQIAIITITTLTTLTSNSNYNQ